MVVIVLRALLLHRLPKALFFWLWMLALLRLLLPVFPASPLSVFARTPVAAPVVQQAAASAVGEGAQATRTEAAIAPAAAQAPPTTAAQHGPCAPRIRRRARSGPDAGAHVRLAGRRPAAGAASGPCLRARPAHAFKAAARPLQSPFIRAWLKRERPAPPAGGAPVPAHRLPDDLRRSAPGHPPARERRQGRHADAFVRAGP